VSMMVTASLTSFAFSWRSVLNAVRGTRTSVGAPSTEETHEVPRRLFVMGLVAALMLATAAQVAIFPIEWWMAMIAVLFTFLLAVVAGRVSGETGITPVGPMGKVTQLLFGVIAPGNAAANLMSANVTGGAASQCADLLHDQKTGLMIGASPRFQTLAQFFGVLAGSLGGAAAYLVLIPDPKGMLLTQEWPAPAVAAWKAVAEVFSEGIETMPEKAPKAILIAGILGIVLAIGEKVLPKKAATWTPSPASIGLALVIPAYYSISMFLGGLIAVVLTRAVPRWSARFLIVIAAGLIAGESLAGVGLAVESAISYVTGGG
ncbi:MAG: OPT/YSL family transporter, partial [Polyangiales bacterium]